MLKKISNTTKLKLMALLIIVFAYLSYDLAIKNTIVSYRACNSYLVKISAAQDAPAQMQKINEELESINVNINTPLNINFQELLLKKVTDFSLERNIILRELPEPHSYKEQDFLVETNKIVVEGNFIDLLTLMFEMEKEFNFSKIAGVVFASKKDQKTERIRLTLTIYYQNIKIIKDEI